MVMFSIMPVLSITGYASVILVCVRAAVDCGRNVHKHCHHFMKLTTGISERLARLAKTPRRCNIVTLTFKVSASGSWISKFQCMEVEQASGEEH